LDHYLLMDERFGDGNAMLRMRKHLGWYTRGMRDSAALRFTVNTTTDTQEILDLLRRFQETLQDDDPSEQNETEELLPIPCLD
jgi:tRNA-dihydrouridine synthase B